MIDWTKPVRQRGNKEVVRVLCTDAPGRLCVVAIVAGYPRCYQIDGRHYQDRSMPMDLENVPDEPKPLMDVWLEYDADWGYTGRVFFNLGAAICKGGLVRFREVRE